MTEAEVVALIEKAIKDLEAKLAETTVGKAVDHVWTDVRQFFVKTAKRFGIGLVAIATVAGAVVVGHIL
jgi:hypothetical protein